MADYIGDNLQFIVNGFMRSGITGAANGEDNDTDATLSGTDSMSDFSDQSDEETNT